MANFQINVGIKMGKILSIIVPSYNMEAYLPKCLGSLIIDDKELLQKLDVIVVNDGSKDRTSEIAHEFESKYTGVFRVIDKPNGHYGSCINAALPVAKGEYVKVLDADDSVETAAFEKMLRVICEELEKGDSAADLIVSDYVSVDPDGKNLKRPKFGLQETSRSLADIQEGWSRLTIHTICYRTQNLLKTGYRQTEGCAYTDTEWIIEPMVTVRRLRYLPIVVTHYLLGREGQTVDVKVLARSFQAILNITEGLVSRYADKCTMCEKEALGYYSRQVRDMVSMSYLCGLLGYEGEKMQGDMKGFDEYLSQYPEFYRESENFVYGPNHFPFRYVAEWRKHGSGLYWRSRIMLSRWLLNVGGLVLPKIRALVRS